MGFYRKSWDFKVTEYVPCSSCNELKPVTELSDHSTYVYGEGYITDKQACSDCHENHVKAAKANVKDTSWGI